MPVDLNFPRTARDHVNLGIMNETKELKSEMGILSSLSAIQTNHKKDSTFSLEVLRLKIDALPEDALNYSYSFYWPKDQPHLTLLC